MAKLREGMIVQIINDEHKLVTGEIVLIAGNTVVVEIPGSIRVKRSASEIVIPTETEDKDEAQQNEESVNNVSEDGFKTITRDQFLDKTVDLTSPEYLVDEIGLDIKSAFARGMATMCVANHIAKKLFGESESIEITKKDLMAFVKDNCSPSELVKTVRGKMSIDQIFPISMFSATILVIAVKELFDEEEND